jgi:sec-independent protein translocase protein TatB
MNLGFSEMLFIFLLALIIFGPKRLPEIGRQIGKALAELRHASNEFKAQLESEMRQIEIEEALNKQEEPAARAILPPERAAGSNLDAPPVPAAEPHPESPAARGPNA